MIRIFDITLSSTFLIIFSPFFLLIMLVLSLTGEKNIFFLQKRVGQNEREFFVYKFVTMLKDSPNLGAGSITEKDDPRVLPVGKLLRITKINELPQLLNVIRGEMSLIGPRPHVERDLQGISKKNLKKMLLLKPGLSGIASIIFRNEEHIIHSSYDGRKFYDQEIAPYKAELEAWYSENINFYMYLLLITITLFKVFNINFLNPFLLFPSLPEAPKNLKKFLD